VLPGTKTRFQFTAPEMRGAMNCCGSIQSSTKKIIQLQIPPGSWNGYLAHGGSLYFCMNKSRGALSFGSAWCSNITVNFHIEIAAQAVVKNLLMTNPTETSVVTSETLKWSLPSKYRGVEVSMALYPLTAKATAKDIATLEIVCASRRNELLNAHASYGWGPSE